MPRIIPNQNTWVGFTVSAPGAVTTPVTAAAATATTGGSLVAATYHYKITALIGSNVSAPSAIESQVVPSGTSTNTVTVNWATQASATGGFDVYTDRISPGTYLKLAHIAAGTYTYIDTGSVTPAGAIPTSGTPILATPHLADITGAIDLTSHLVSINAMAQGNAVPTPSFDTLFETTILGTSQATFTADFYRDTDGDLAWLTLPRSTAGYFLIARYGGIPTTGGTVEVWPVTILSRAMANMANNTVETFTVTCAVPLEPNEAAVVGV